MSKAEEYLSDNYSSFFEILGIGQMQDITEAMQGFAEVYHQSRVKAISGEEIASIINEFTWVYNGDKVLEEDDFKNVSKKIKEQLLKQ
jgi:hypothetical protein